MGLWLPWLRIQDMDLDLDAQRAVSLAPRKFPNVVLQREGHCIGCFAGCEDVVLSFRF